MKNTLLALGVVIAVLFTASVNANAQSNSSCLPYWYQSLYYGYPTGWWPPLPANAANCVSFLSVGGYMMICWDVRSTCNAPPSWCPTCAKNQAALSKPINLANGNTYIHQSDVRIPGLGGGLSLQRTWNSMWPGSINAFQSGMFGPHWRSTYEERLFQGSGDASGYMVYLRADASVWYFGPGASPLSLSSPMNTTATLTSGSTYWTLKFQNGEQRRFDNNSGSLIAIIDRNGNTTSLSYDGANRLVTVTDPASRHLNFTYGNSSYPNQVTSVSSDVGLSLSYAYDTQGRLGQVTLPDSSTSNFAYDSQSLITSVTDSQGRILESHTYDSKGRGLTSSQANGVNAVAITYPQ